MTVSMSRTHTRSLGLRFQLLPCRTKRCMVHRYKFWRNFALTNPVFCGWFALGLRYPRSKHGIWSGTSRRSFRVLNIDGSSILAQLRAKRQNLLRRPRIFTPKLVSKNHTSFGPTGKELESWPQTSCVCSTHWDGHFAVFKSTVAWKTKKLFKKDRICFDGWEAENFHAKTCIDGI